MSAIVCGKRSSIFEEIPSPSSSNSPVSKRIRYNSFSPPLSSGFQSPFLLLDQLRSIFPFMDNKVIEQVLENSGHDLDLAIKSLNDLRLGCVENNMGAADAFPDTNRQPINQLPVHLNSSVHENEGRASAKDQLPSKDIPVDGAEWVELFVREMSAASDVNDARVRATRALEAFEKSISARASSETAQNFQQENMMLKEQVQALLQENGILKRAVSIQHERQKEYESKSDEVQQLKQLLSQCQEHIRTLEVNNYALGMHLKQAQQNNTIPSRFNPDVF